jgi:hypothetical protein
MTGNEGGEQAVIFVFQAAFEYNLDGLAHDVL